MLFPLGDLIRMNGELPGDLVDRQFAPDSFQSNFGFEFGTISFTFFGGCHSVNFRGNFNTFSTLATCLNFGVHYNIKPLLPDEMRQYLSDQLSEQNDLTLLELSDRVNEKLGLRVSTLRLCEAPN